MTKDESEIEDFPSQNQNSKKSSKVIDYVPLAQSFNL